MHKAPGKHGKALIHACIMRCNRYVELRVHGGEQLQQANGAVNGQNSDACRGSLLGRVVIDDFAKHQLKRIAGVRGKAVVGRKIIAELRAAVLWKL